MPDALPDKSRSAIPCLVRGHEWTYRPHAIRRDKMVHYCSRCNRTAWELGRASRP